MSDALIMLRQNRGLRVKIAREIGISSSAVYQWPIIPSARVLDVERITGISRHELRPDLYPPEIERVGS